MRSAVSRFPLRLAVGLCAFALLSAAAGPVGSTCGGACQPGVLSNGAVSAAAAADTNFSITGVVDGVSYDLNVIDVMVAGVKQSIHVTPTTSIAKHGEAGSMADIRPGAHVSVSGVVQNGQRVAVTIEIK